MAQTLVAKNHFHETFSDYQKRIWSNLDALRYHRHYLKSYRFLLNTLVTLTFLLLSLSFSSAILLAITFFNFGVNIFGSYNRPLTINLSNIKIFTYICVAIGIIILLLFAALLKVYKKDTYTPIKSIHTRFVYLFVIGLLFSGLSAIIISVGIPEYSRYQTLLNDWSAQFFSQKNISIPLSVIPIIVNAVLINGVPAILSMFLLGTIFWFLVSSRMSYTLGFLITLTKTIQTKLGDESFDENLLQDDEPPIITEDLGNNTSTQLNHSTSELQTATAPFLVLEQTQLIEEKKLELLFQLEYQISDNVYFVENFNVYQILEDEPKTTKKILSEKIQKKYANLTDIQEMFNKLIVSYDLS